METLFDLPLSAVKRPEPVRIDVDEDGLRAFAFLYTVTQTPTATGIRFGATVDDAQKWCDSPISRGQLHGVSWVYCWTSAWNYIRNYSGDTDTYDTTRYAYQLDIRGLRDNGTWDERIASTGCRIVRLEDFASVLEPMGVSVIADPRAAYESARRTAA